MRVFSKAIGLNIARFIGNFLAFTKPKLLVTTYKPPPRKPPQKKPWEIAWCCKRTL